MRTKKSSAIAMPLLFAVAFSLVLASGCIGQAPQIPIGIEGMVIKNIVTDPPADQIRTTDAVIKVSADVENVGGATARNVVAELGGVSWVPPQAPNIRLNNWFDYDEDPNDNGFTHGSAIGRTFYPPTEGRLGTFRPTEFILPPPLLPEGQKVSYPLWIRVTYDYSTSGTAIVRGYSHSQYLSELQRGTITPVTRGPLTVQQTPNTPIHISIDGPDKLDIDDNYFEDTFKITLTNVGRFVPITRDPTTGEIVDGLIYPEIWINGPGVFPVDCFGAGPSQLAKLQLPESMLEANFKSIFAAYQEDDWFIRLRWIQDVGERLGITVGGKNWFINLNEEQQKTFYRTMAQNPPVMYRFFPQMVHAVRLQRGQSKTFTCTIGIRNFGTGISDWANRPSDNIEFNIFLRYRYYIEEPFSITVSAPIIRAPPPGVKP